MDYQAPQYKRCQISESSYSLDYQAPDPTPAELEMPWKSGVVETIWGSINGVLLVDIDKELCLWNPSIRMYQKISPPKFTGRYSIEYALGYDSINDDFKVVAAVSPTGDVPSTVHVFSSKLSSWKSIGDFGYSCSLRGRGSDGEFVLKLRSGMSGIPAKFAIYNPKRKTYKRIEKPENWKGHEIDVYVESLVFTSGLKQH
ncbi:hypothetical protein RHGRI_012424 [Rhododendron griersonianum]|uniref:F-box associated beta-propeller type 3 domain-containing protein n=1 Tax=Rhododendron griersonianum TaxID=479676 RepID=A0AAV6KRH4_9ERIC|nr:hypothetical protein RHGRI_012424 [Rhododendron griersonianum]